MTTARRIQHLEEKVARLERRLAARTAQVIELLETIAATQEALNQQGLELHVTQQRQPHPDGQARSTPH